MMQGSSKPGPCWKAKKKKVKKQEEARKDVRNSDLTRVWGYLALAGGDPGGKEEERVGQEGRGHDKHCAV